MIIEFFRDNSSAENVAEHKFLTNWQGLRIIAKPMDNPRMVSESINDRIDLSLHLKSIFYSY